MHVTDRGAGWKMTGAFVCEQCKKASAQCSRSSSRSSGKVCPPSTSKRKCPVMSRPVYVKADPSDQTCIVVGASQPSSGCGGDASAAAGPSGRGGISLRFPASTRNLQVCMPDLSKTNGGSGSGDPNCIQIMGNQIVKTSNGGIQIMPCKAKAGGGGGSGGVQISVVRSERGGGGTSCATLGESSGGSKSNNIELSFGKDKGGQPAITCQCGQHMQITLGPEKRKLNMNHLKNTVASMIHQRLIALEFEQKLANRSRSDIHERR